MSLDFLKWLRLVQQKRNLLGSECFGAQQVAQTFWHGSSKVRPGRKRVRDSRFVRSPPMKRNHNEYGGGLARLFHAFNQHDALFLIHFRQANLDDFSVARLYVASHETGLDRQFAMPPVKEHRKPTT